MSSSELFYLKEDAYFEPLFNQWYAWPYLLPPVQCARYTVATHLRLMKSFVKNHQLHIAASKQLVGGEFLYSKKEDLAEITNIIDNTEKHHQDLIELAAAVSELNEILKSHQSGESIEPLYEKIPGPLKGYIELFMDLEHNPSYRILESLIYKSDFYKKGLQSVSFGLISRVGERPFILSTPRVPDDNHLHLQLPFNSPLLKSILATREAPMPMSEIKAIFDQCDIRGGLDYKELFTSERISRNHSPVKEGVRLEYTGHAGFLIESKDVTIMIDPVIACRNEKDPQFMTGFSDLPESIDYICLTHTHQDHVHFETLLQLRHKTKKILVPKNNGGTLSDPSLKLMLKELEFDVTEVDDLDIIPVSGGAITSIPFLGEHGDLNIRSKSAWLVELGGKKQFFGADSSCLDKNMYMHLKKIVGEVDILAIGMECVGAPYTWLYGALYSDKVSKNIKDSRRLNGADAKQALTMVEIFNPKQVYIYALGFEACFKYFMGIEYDDDSTQIVETNKLIEACKPLGKTVEKLIGSKTIEVD